MRKSIDFDKFFEVHPHGAQLYQHYTYQLKYIVKLFNT